MDRLVSIPWLDDAEPFYVRGVPLNGHREIQKAKAKQAEAITAVLNSQQLLVYATAIKARGLMDKQGPEKARDAWNATLKTRGMLDKGLDWSMEDFEASLLEFITDKVYAQLGVEDDEAAEEAIAEKTRELREKWGDAMDAIQSASIDYQLIEAYWLIRASDAKRVTVRGESPVEFSRSNTDRDAMLNLVGDNLTDEHFLALVARDQKPSTEVDKHELLDAEVVRGKSMTDSASSTNSNGSSTPSSEYPTGTTSESEMSGARSG